MIKLSVDGSELTVPIHFSKEHLILKHHVVSGLKVLPGVAHLKIALEYAHLIAPFCDLNCIEDVSWINPVICLDDCIDLVLHLTGNPDCIKFSFRNYTGKVYSSGRISRNLHAFSKLTPKYEDFVYDRSIDNNLVYDEFARLGILYGEFFKCLTNTKIKTNLGMADIYSKSNQLNFINLLDCSFQSGMAISLRDNFKNLMPISLGRLIIKDNTKISCREHYFALTKKNNHFRTSIQIADNHNDVIMYIKDLGIKPGKF